MWSKKWREMDRTTATETVRFWTRAEVDRDRCGESSLDDGGRCAAPVVEESKRKERQRAGGGTVAEGM